MISGDTSILTFDWNAYYNKYKERIISDLGINIKNRDIAWHHWNNFGNKYKLQYFTLDKPDTILSINPHSSDEEFIRFDWKEYIKKNPDLKNVNSKEIAWGHWYKYGKKEGRNWESEEKKLENNAEYKHFCWEQYIINYEDLSLITNKMDAWKHWIIYGKKEGRTFEDPFINDDEIKNIVTFTDYETSKEYINFDWEKYVNTYNDLGHFLNKKTAWEHWSKNGKKERRVYFSIKEQSDNNNSNSVDVPNSLPIINTKKNICKNYENEFYNEYCNFDWKMYIENYDDLSYLDNKEDAWEHWIYQGRLGGRTIVNLSHIDAHNQIMIEIEKNCYPENILVTEEPMDMDPDYDYIYITRGNIKPVKLSDKGEKTRLFNNDLAPNNSLCERDMERHKQIMKNVLHIKTVYKNKMDDFMDKYNIHNSQDVYNDPKIEFRYFCFKYLDYFRNCFVLPEIELNSDKEAVLIEFRDFPHIEFLIRNAIMRLGTEWSYTVVCGNDNYNSMISICNNISKNIKIIKTVNNNITISEYNVLLKSVDFWEMLKGDTIMLYQEDSFIFNDGVEKFIHCDYIGAPWHKGILPISVGNGGISLRKRQVMIDVIEAVNKENKFTKEIIVEDVYFSKNMQRLNIGTVADWDIAFQFSSELFYNGDSFAGHQFWLSDSFWKDRLYESIYSYMCNIKIEKPKITNEDLEQLNSVGSSQRSSEGVRQLNYNYDDDTRINEDDEEKYEEEEEKNKEEDEEEDEEEEKDEEEDKYDYDYDYDYENENDENENENEKEDEYNADKNIYI